MGKNFTRALRHLRSNQKTTRLDEKKQVLNEIPTMNMSGVYSKNPPGFRYDPPSPAKRFVPDIDGNWPAGVPGTPGDTEYIRPQGYWVNDSDWENFLVPDLTVNFTETSTTNTDGFIDPQSGTVKTLLPPNSRDFILGPLIDGYTYNHGYDDYTTIGYIQKDTRQIVVLGQIQGHWDTTRILPSRGTANREWDGTASQFTAYNPKFTLEMAQWFKDKLTANDFTKNFPYFYSGGIPQSPLNPQPEGSPGNMPGGNMPGTGGGGGGPNEGPPPGTPTGGSGGEPDTGEETPQGDPEGGGPDDLNLWGMSQSEAQSKYGHMSDDELARLGIVRNPDGTMREMTEKEKRELEKKKEEERKLRELQNLAQMYDNKMLSDIKYASVTIAGIAIWSMGQYVAALIAAGYASYEIQKLLNEAVATVNSTVDTFDQQDIADIGNIQTSILKIEGDLVSDEKVGGMSDAEWDKLRGDQAEKENDAIIRVKDKLDKARNGGRKKVERAAEKALEKLKDIKAKNKARRQQITKLRKQAQKLVDEARAAHREMERLGIKNLKDAPPHIREKISNLRNAMGKNVRGEVNRQYIKRHFPKGPGGEFGSYFDLNIRSDYQPRGTLLREDKKRIIREITQPLKEIKELPKTQKLEKYRPNFAGKYKPQNTPNVTASKKSDEMVKAKNAAGQTWRTKDKYWGGYESQERMNVVYDNVGHGSEYFDRIVNENLSKRNAKNRQIQEHLNVIAHEKAMRQLDSNFVSPFRNIEEQETLDAPKDPLYKKVAKRLNTEIDYPKKPSPKGYPDKPPVQLDPNTGMHPKYGKRYKYDKLDPQSAEAMPVQGNPEIDANVQKALDKRAKDRKIKNLTVNTTNEKVDWRETLEKRNVGESKKNFKNLRKDLQEQLYTNVTTGMKVGQTLKHIPSGQTFKTGGALGGTETLPSTFPIFGESEPAPDASFYPLQGYAKPMDMMRRKNRENLEDINARLDASQEFAQKVNSDVMMNARLSLDEFSDQIKAKDLAYEQRQKKIQVLQDKQDIVYNKYKPQLDVLNDKLEKIASKYFNPDTWGTDEKVNDDPEYKDLLKQMQKLSDAEDAENDPLQAEIDKLRSEADSGYQVPGSKEYKDMQRVSFDEWIKKVPPFAYGSKDNFLINDPETRWKYMDDWGNQGKRPMNLSRITALKTVLNPNTGKPYTDWHPEDPQSELGEYVSSKLKDIGEIQWDGYRGMGSSINPSELYRDVLSKGPAVLDIYMQELTVFEENMTGVNNLLEKDLKEVVKKLKKEYKKSSEINRITYKQAENLKYYKNYLEQIKNHKANISRVLPSIQNAFAGNFEPTPTPTPIKPPAGFDGDGDYIPSGEGTFDKDGNYYPPGFEDAIRTDQINNLDNKQIDTAVKDVGNSFGPNIGTGFRIFGDFITKGHNERFVADRKYLGKEYMNRQFFPNVSFDKNGTYVKNDVVVGSGQPAKYNEKTGMLEIRATFDFKKNAHEVESAIASEKGEKADWADRFARTGSEYALDAMVDPLPGVLKPLSGIVASHFISTAKMFGKGKTIPIVIKITPAELKNKNKKAYKELVELGVISKDK